MIKPIYAYGNEVLNQEGDWIEEGHEGLTELIADMFETMDNAGGIGLAAQQIGLPFKIFVLDLTAYKERGEQYENLRKVFLNSEILEESEETNEFEEGCLSFPGISINVIRPEKVKVLYQDENFVEHEEWIDGMYATAFQHEHDHTEGVVFTSHATPLKKKLLKKKLKEIKKGHFQKKFPVKINP